MYPQEREESLTENRAAFAHVHDNGVTTVSFHMDGTVDRSKYALLVSVTS